MTQTLFEVCPPLPTAREMAEWDRLAAESCGLTTDLLMDSAGREAFALLRERFPRLEGRRVLLLAGPGNNGGDAIVLARRLHDAGSAVRLVLTRPVEDYAGAAGTHLDIALRCGVPAETLDPAANDLFAAVWPISDAFPEIIVDGLLGFGLSGPPRPPMPGLFKAVNRFRRLNPAVFILALDLPSGLDGDTGKPAGGPDMPVRADETITFQAAKPGLVLARAAPYVGRLRVADIGLPRAVQMAAPPRQRLISPAVAALLPRPAPNLHKGSAGRVLVVGGSLGLTGAPLLAALGALRAGAGLVTVACPGGLAREIKAGFPEVMTWPLGQSDRLEPDDAATLLDGMDRFDAVAIGPGLGREAETGAFLARLLEGLDEDLAVILDADGIMLAAASSDRSALLKALGGRALLTPHPGEMAALLDSDIESVEADRPGAVRAVTTVYGVNLLLKGANSLLGGPDGTLFVSPIAQPALAVGGSGDVLTGLFAAVTARGRQSDLDSAEAVLQAACVSAYWHGFAGEILARRAPRGHLARELADALPEALTEILAELTTPE